MKLEIKHLAPYLPYNLKLVEGELSAISNRWGTVKYIDSDKDDYNTSPERIKPKLRPLSEFGDSDNLREVHEFIGLGGWCEAYDHYFDAWFNDACSIGKLVLQAPYEVMQYFFSNHFDVFGLIDAGLAVEIKNVQPNNEPLCGVGKKIA